MRRPPRDRVSGGWSDDVSMTSTAALSDVLLTWKQPVRSNSSSWRQPSSKLTTPRGHTNAVSRSNKVTTSHWTHSQGHSRSLSDVEDVTSSHVDRLQQTRAAIRSRGHTRSRDTFSRSLKVSDVDTYCYTYASERILLLSLLQFQLETFSCDRSYQLLLLLLLLKNKIKVTLSHQRRCRGTEQD